MRLSRLRRPVQGRRKLPHQIPEKSRTRITVTSRACLAAHPVINREIYRKKHNRRKGIRP